jgi:predicted LPLAT superfamily acyltransferase
MASSESQHWSGTGQLRGGRGGIWFFITALRVLGLHLTYALLPIVAAYYSFASPDVRATMDYHRRVFGRVPWWKRRWLVFRHFLSFGIALIDRTAILAGKTRHFSFSFDGEEHLRAALAGGRGVLLLTAHVGNWEAAGQLLTRLDVPINVTGFDNETPGIRSLLNQASKPNFRLLPLTGSPTDTIPLVAALRRGEIVAMLGDRSYGSPAGHYRCIGFPPQHPRMPSHDQRDAYLRDCAGRFARDLESIVKRGPLQWYNFYPFWERSEERSISQSNVPAVTNIHDEPKRVPHPETLTESSSNPGNEIQTS